MSKNNRKLVHGWGINDSPTPVYWTELVDGKVVRKKCPAYADWVEIIRRAKSELEKLRHPTYENVGISEDFRYFTDFKFWVLNVQPNKDWKNCDLDKDLLSTDFKIYSPSTSAYLSSEVNKLMMNSGATRGQYLLGVYFEEVTGKYRACCQNPFTGKNDKLGRFSTELDAHHAWQAKKHSHACMIASRQTDPRVADALRQRYAPDKDWTKA
jgi:hypothetical protein